jgi:hypothetical protein
MKPSYAARILACSGLGAAVVAGVVTAATGFDVSFADVHAAAVSAADAITATPSQRPVRVTPTSPGLHCDRPRWMRRCQPHRTRERRATRMGSAAFVLSVNR